MCELGAAVSVNRCIYLVGGFSQSCLRYDPATDSWTRLSQPRQSQEHSNAPAVVWQGGVLVAGGRDGDDNRSVSTEHYNPVLDEWTPLKEKLSSHRTFSVIISGV